MEYLGAWGTLIHEKNLKSKISCQTPFKSLAVHSRRVSNMNQWSYSNCHLISWSFRNYTVKVGREIGEYSEHTLFTE
jgi:hypothetical protein